MGEQDAGQSANQEKRVISADSVYEKLNPFVRWFIQFWNGKICKISQDKFTQEAIVNVNKSLETGNVVIFFDHHYAFDAFPVALTLGETLRNASNALVPYATHLDLGVDGSGKKTTRYKWRTRIFKWLVDKVGTANPNIQLMPVARKFELTHEVLKKMIEKDYERKNMNYFEAFMKSFQEFSEGFVCMISPIGGLAFPDKPILHKKLYFLFDSVRTNLQKDVSFFYVSAYPRLKKKWHYRYPMLVRHDFLARGPIEFPNNDYEGANASLKKEVMLMRETAEFEILDYSVIKNK